MTPGIPWTSPPVAARPAMVALLLVLASACGDDGWSPSGEARETIDRETFVSTYVDLRHTALQDTTASIAPAERERVLRRHGVTREDLLRFVEVHGERVEFMRKVWDEVEERIRRARDEGDTASS